MSRWSKVAKKRRNPSDNVTSTILVTREVHDFIMHNLKFLVDKGMIPLWVYDERTRRPWRSLSGIPRVVHKQDRIQITVEPAFKTLIATIARRERVNLYDATYLAVTELMFTPEE